MTIQFPAIKPSDLTFTPARSNVTTPKFRDIIVSPRLLSNKPNGPTLSLNFRAISADDILAIFNTWKNSYSGFFGFSLPEVITSSITLAAFEDRILDTQSIVWRFSGEPTLSNMSAGYGDVSVQLIGDQGDKFIQSSTRAFEVISYIDFPESFSSNLGGADYYDPADVFGEEPTSYYLGYIFQLFADNATLTELAVWVRSNPISDFSRTINFYDITGAEIQTNGLPEPLTSATVSKSGTSTNYDYSNGFCWTSVNPISLDQNKTYLILSTFGPSDYLLDRMQANDGITGASPVVQITLIEQVLCIGKVFGNIPPPGPPTPFEYDEAGYTTGYGYFGPNFGLNIA